MISGVRSAEQNRRRPGSNEAGSRDLHGHCVPPGVQHHHTERLQQHMAVSMPHRGAAEAHWPSNAHRLAEYAEPCAMVNSVRSQQFPSGLGGRAMTLWHCSIGSSGSSGSSDVTQPVSA